MTLNLGSIGSLATCLPYTYPIHSIYREIDIYESLVHDEVVRSVLYIYQRGQVFRRVQRA